MSTQICHDWSPAGYSSNPIPGDADAVQGGATDFRHTADRLSEAATGLRRLDDSDLDAKSTTVLWNNAREIAGLLEMAFNRYDLAARALGTYAPILAKAQRDAEAALQAATTAAADQQQAANNANDIWWAAKATIDPTERQQFLTAFHRAKSQAEAASSSWHGARAKIEAAVHDRDVAATTAGQQIHDAISGRELNDTFLDRLGELWDHLKQFTEDMLEFVPGLRQLVDIAAAVGKWIWDNIDTIATVLTILSLVAGWIPVAGWVVAALAVAANVARVASYVKFAVEVGTAAAHGDWGTAIIMGATFGVSMIAGRYAAKGAQAGLNRLGKEGFKGLARASVGQTGSYRTATNALRAGTPSPTYHPGHHALDVSSSALTRRTDSLIAAFKGSDFNDYARNMNNLVKFTQHPLVVHYVSESATKVAEDAVEYVGNRAQDGYDGYHKQVRIPCEVSR